MSGEKEAELASSKKPSSCLLSGLDSDDDEGQALDPYWQTMLNVSKMPEPKDLRQVQVEDKEKAREERERKKDDRIFPGRKGKGKGSGKGKGKWNPYRQELPHWALAAQGKGKWKGKAHAENHIRSFVSWAKNPNARDGDEDEDYWDDDERERSRSRSPRLQPAPKLGRGQVTSELQDFLAWAKAGRKEKAKELLKAKEEPEDEDSLKQPKEEDDEKMPDERLPDTGLGDFLSWAREGYEDNKDGYDDDAKDELKQEKDEDEDEDEEDDEDWEGEEEEEHATEE